MRKTVLTILPERQALDRANLALLTAGAGLTGQMDASLTAVLLGYGVGEEAGQLAAWGAEKILVCDGEAFAGFQNDLFSNVLYPLLREEAPEVVLLGGDCHAQELAATLAARLRTGLTAEALELRYDAPSGLVRFRTAAVGNVVADIVCPRARPQMATVKTDNIEPQKMADEAAAEIVRIPAPETSTPRVRLLDREAMTHTGAALLQAPLVVVAGLGVGSREGLTRVRAFAARIGAAVGVTRAVVNAGWADESEMIGQTGLSIAPEVCIELGVSGAVQHVAGLRRAKCLIAVNRNRETPIFDAADWGIAADLFAFMEAFEKAYLEK